MKNVFFLHIRKTGGTSLRGIIEKFYDKELRCPILSSLHMRRVIKQSDQKNYLNQFQFISGHYYGIKQILDDSFTTITILRDPIDRTISEYNHMIYDEKDPLHKYAKGRNILECLEDPRLAIAMQNGQSRYFISNAGYDYDSIEDDEKIQISLDCLTNQCLFGFTELFNITCDYICNNFGWKVPEKVPYLNQKITEQGSKRKDLIGVLGHIEKVNQVDLTIYREARTIFDKRVADFYRNYKIKETADIEEKVEKS